MSKSQMKTAFLDQLDRPPINVHRDHSKLLDVAIERVRSLESRERDAERDDLRKTWFYYGWQAALKSIDTYCDGNTPTNSLTIGESDELEEEMYAAAREEDLCAEQRLKELGYEDFGVWAHRRLATRLRGKAREHAEKHER